MLNKQEIGSGSDGNTQITANKVTVGIDYIQAREIAKDVFETNFLKYKDEAQVIIDKRLEDFNSSLMSKIKEKKISDLSVFGNPDFLYNLYEAQKTYVRWGDKDQEAILTSILLERFGEKTNTLKQIILNEALQVIPKLTKRHVNMLTLIFVLKQTRSKNIDTFENFCSDLGEWIDFFEENIDHKPLEIQHLEFTGCGKTGMINFHLINNYKAKYLEAFVKKDTNVNIDDLNKISQLIRYDLNGISMGLRKDSLNMPEFCKILGEDKKKVGELIDIYQKNIMSDDEIMKKIIETHPKFECFYKKWANSWIQSFSLSSVGKAIGLINANTRASLTNSYYNLDTWIS